MSWLAETFFSLLHAVRVAPGVPPPYSDRLAALDPSSSKLDNQIYNTSSFDWSKSGLSLLNPVRVSYFLDMLDRRIASLTPDELHEVVILDLGCGSGLAIEAIHNILFAQQPNHNANVSYKLIGLDMSKRSIDLARSNATSCGLQIEYIVGDIYDLPFSPNSIDAVICSDVLEHLFDLPSAFASISSVLKPGGIFTFDTINRTPVSYYLTIWILQDILNAMQGDAHDHRLYVKPQEVHDIMQRSGLKPGPKTDLVGMRPGINWPWTALSGLWRGQGFVMSVLGEFKLTKDLGVSFLHWCEKGTQ